jgi:Plant protein of unknown function
MEKKKKLCMKELDKKAHVGGGNSFIVSNLFDNIKYEFQLLEDRARACYRDKIKLDSNTFIEMLALDCCFLIRVVMLVSQVTREGMDLLGIDIKEIRSDLLILENQIPLFLLFKAYECFCRQTIEPVPSFLQILEPFICLDMPWRFNENGMSPEAAHLLDLYWRCCLPHDHKLQLTDRFISDDTYTEQRIWAEFNLSACMNKIIPNSTVLHKKSGVKFIKRNNDEGFGISFKDGILKIPFTRIDLTQKIILLNLVFFEYFMHVPYRVSTSYVLFLDALIDTDKDIELLQEHEVISNTLFDNAKAAGFFNQMGKYCSVNEKDNYFLPLCKEVKKYYKSSWNRSCAILHNNYFNSPWAGISVVAGSALLLMSFLQTFYTVYAYHHPPK